MRERRLAFLLQVDEIVRLDGLMFTSIDGLEECEYQVNAFAELLAETQKVIDEFCLHDYSNIALWIGTIDRKIEEKLFTRLKKAIELWKEAVLRKDKTKTKGKKRMRLKVDDDDNELPTSRFRSENHLGNPCRQPNGSAVSTLRIRS